MKDEALKLALKTLAWNNAEWKAMADSGDCGYWKAEERDHHIETEKAIAAIKKALAQPKQAPCDMGVMCAGCTPRNSDNSCPAAQPEQDVPEVCFGNMAVQPAPVQQEPVGMFWFNPQDKLWYQTLSYHDDDDDDRYQPFYATAVQRKPLTDEEIITAYETSGHKQSIRPQDVFAVASLARAIEAKLKELNHEH